MKFRIFYTVILANLFLLFSCDQGNSQKEVKLASTEDSVSYSIGLNVGNNIAKDFEKQGLADELDADILLAGFEKAIKKQANTLVESKDAERIIRTFFAAQQEKEMAKLKKEGEAFLAKNKERSEVVTLESGLQYEILKEGKGPKPTATDKVKVDYVGTLIDGTEFDSSIKRGKPAEFGVTGVIKGWTEALQLMPVGSKWKLYIPSDLAYGARQTGQFIKPNSTLIFEVELLEILPKTTEKK